MIWAISGYEKAGGRLIAQYDLAGVTADFLRPLVGLGDGEPVVACYPLSPAALTVLTPFAKGLPALDSNAADYFLEAYSGSDIPEEYRE